MKERDKLVVCRGISCRDAICSISTKSDWERWLTVAQNLDVRHCLIWFEEWRSSSRALLTHLASPHLCDRPYRAIPSDIGGDVLLHDGGGTRQQTVEAVSTIIRKLKQQGYRFVTVPQLLEMQAAQKQQTADQKLK